jgi:hypothetical protein
MLSSFLDCNLSKTDSPLQTLVDTSWYNCSVVFLTKNWILWVSRGVSTGVLQLIFSQIDIDFECSFGWFSCVPPPQPFLCWKMLFHRWNALVYPCFFPARSFELLHNFVQVSIVSFWVICALLKRGLQVSKKIWHLIFSLLEYTNSVVGGYLCISCQLSISSKASCFLIPFLILYQCAL